ncbi:inorganic pyrophosphatase [Pavlovales sp. CCMP2436]|nr:inorganic pyrophosphatase [Pavlovales sp. CCMP2436]
MDEALTLVADAVRSARGLRLDSTVSVTLQRAVGDNQLTFVVQVPPAGQVEAAAAAAPRTFARASAPPRAIAMGGESSEMRPRVEPALGPRMNSEIDVLAISGVGERRETLGGTAESDEVKTLMAEIERLKRKALSRGVNLTSQHEDVPAEDVARLRAVFSMADSTGSGYINASELQALHALLGEPLTDEEASDAFRRIDVNQSGDISFDDFLSWFTLAHSRSGMLSKKGLAYNQRFKKLFARIEGLFDLKNLTVSSQGVIGTLEFRLNFHYNDNGVLKRVSPWHDIPLYSQDGNVHFICEQLRSGSVTRVKVLGVLAMIDDGETDWKVLCISVDDPYASRINNCDDLNQIFPNMIPTVREWFRVYKTADGKPENKFGFGEKAMDREFALKCVEETHEFWKTLTLSGQKTV